ncbi:hypothetical protein MP638_000859 [Amoeboaphelidium occidentale]|nr:hypothetical protein MP638_000859 [Amoeboaphelidium occidentale]
MPAALSLGYTKSFNTRSPLQRCTSILWKRRNFYTALLPFVTHSPATTQKKQKPNVISVAKRIAFKPLFAIACAARAAYLALVFTPSILLLPVSMLRPSIYPLWYDVLLRSLELSGPTFIKLGQWASTRPDIFPEDLCVTLRKLHDQVPPHSYEYTMKAIEKSFHKKMDDIFTEFTEKPIGCGCIAQVHKARIKYPEECDVAVKVVHPYIKPLIEADLAIMMFTARIIDMLPNMKWLSFPEEVQEFSSLMLKQLDMRVEARNLKKFRNNFKTIPYCTFPRPIDGLVTEQVLVETFSDALPMASILDCKDENLKRQVADLGLKSFLKMLLEDNFVHSDLHPGNILVKVPTSSNSLIEKELHLLKPPHPQLEFVDAGLVTVLSEKNMLNFIDLFAALVDGDGREIARLMVERSRMEGVPDKDKKLFCRNYDKFEAEMESLIQNVQEKTFSLATIHISEVLGNVLNLVRDHHVKIESDFTNLVVSIMVLEGLGRQLNPEVDLFEAAKPLLRFRRAQFYTLKQGLFLKFAAFVEARSVLMHTDDDEIYDNTNQLLSLT